MLTDSEIIIPHQADNYPDTQIETGDRNVAAVSEQRKKMRILLVEPESPTSYWSHSHALPLIGKKASHCPLGLITVGSMLPPEWELRLADLNTGPLSTDTIAQSDAVFLGGMHIQANSFHEQIARAKAAGKIVVGGGPYVTSSPEECQDLDHLVLGEVEAGIDEWCQKFEQGKAPKIAMMPRPDILNRTEVPRYDLIDPRHYFEVNVQLSRGCPHNCEFCSVTKLNGHKPRLKSAEQVVAELEAIRKTGFRGSGFLVDDNFIGNRRGIKERLRAIIAWQKQYGYPLDFCTQTSVLLAEDEELMELMVEAGISGVFLGIETPSKRALQEANKKHNTRMDLQEAVKRIAQKGLEPMGGFIIGFDSDTEEDLDELKRFIKEGIIPSAMVGPLQAAPLTDLRKRMEREGRLLPVNGREFSGDQFSTTNFKTVMDPETLRAKYAEILTSIYEPKNYFDRCLRLMRASGPAKKHSIYRHRLGFALNALKNSVLEQGIRSEYRAEYWRFLVRAAMETPSKLHTAITHAVKLHHYYTYTHQNVLPRMT